MGKKREANNLCKKNNQWKLKEDSRKLKNDLKNCKPNQKNEAALLSAVKKRRHLMEKRCGQIKENCCKQLQNVRDERTKKTRHH